MGKRIRTEENGRGEKSVKNAPNIGVAHRKCAAMTENGKRAAVTVKVGGRKFIMSFSRANHIWRFN